MGEQSAHSAEASVKISDRKICITQNTQKRKAKADSWEKKREYYHFRDWKTAADNTVKEPQHWHFKFATAKRSITIPYKSGQGIHQGEATYCTHIGASIPIIRKGKGLNTMNPSVKEHFGPEWHNREDLGFYRDLLPCGKYVAENISDEEDDNPMEHDVAVQSGRLYSP
ncbi:hypothetical protein PR048_005891 [Dryococelus australis]|uniref:Uncharacterized protein n=1 Tax=Dryococelus australis TaxID=614101 RepID=A0ABQ9I9G0_9NEOP|nr:hypothetical protein PR048_005891 [Dryococelus australis]